MATGALDANGIWIYGEDDSETTFSGLLNKLGDSVSDKFTGGLAIASGGTGATTVAAAQAALGVAVVQVVSNTYSTQISNASGNYQDTGLSATITPTSASNKILVLVHQGNCQKAVGSAAYGIALILKRNTADLVYANAGKGVSADLAMGTISMSRLDEPGTTAALTYKTMFLNDGGGTVWVQQAYTQSTITLIEVKG